MIYIFLKDILVKSMKLTVNSLVSFLKNVFLILSNTFLRSSTGSWEIWDTAFPVYHFMENLGIDLFCLKSSPKTQANGISLVYIW